MVNLAKIRKKVKDKVKGDLEPQPEAAGSGGAGGQPPPPAPSVAAGIPAPDPEPILAGATPPPQIQESTKESAFRKLETFKQTAGKRRKELEALVSRAGTGEEAVVLLELLSFSIAGEQYAVEIEKIVEIIEPRPVTRIPNADATIVGIISLRGTIVTILDVRKKLGHSHATPGPDTRIIVVENSGETAGFLVDRVSRVIKIDPSRLESHPVVSVSEQSAYIRGVFQQGPTLSILLDLEKILSV